MNASRGPKTVRGEAPFRFGSAALPDIGIAGGAGLGPRSRGLLTSGPLAIPNAANTSCRARYPGRFVARGTCRICYLSILHRLLLSMSSLSVIMRKAHGVRRLPYMWLRLERPTALVGGLCTSVTLTYSVIFTMGWGDGASGIRTLRGLLARVLITAPTFTFRHG